MNSFLTTAPRSVLRGVSQIFFISNSLSGILILAGIAIFDIRMAVLVLLGSAVQSLGGWACGFADDVKAGLMGFNGALVGAAMGLALPQWGLGILLTIIGAFACIPIHRLLAEIFELPALQTAHLPVATAPFCTVAGLLVTLVAPWTTTRMPSSSEEPVSGALLGFANVFSEVVLADGWISGVIIIVALFVGSWKIGLLGLLGGVISVLFFGLLPLSTNWSDVSTGLYGYSSVLVSIALGAVFFTQFSFKKRFILALIGVALSWGVQAILAYTVIPIYTWPFVLAMWVVMYVVALVGERPQSIELASREKFKKFSGES